MLCIYCAAENIIIIIIIKLYVKWFTKAKCMQLSQCTHHVQRTSYSEYFLICVYICSSDEIRISILCIIAAQLVSHVDSGEWNSILGTDNVQCAMCIVHSGMPKVVPMVTQYARTVASSEVRETKIVREQYVWTERTVSAKPREKVVVGHRLIYYLFSGAKIRIVHISATKCMQSSKLNCARAF